MGIHNRKKQYGFASVQPREAKVVRKISKKSIIIAGSIVALFIIGGSVFAISKSNINLKPNLAAVSNFFKREDKKEESTNKYENVVLKSEKESINNTVVLDSDKNTNEKIKLAILASPNLFDYKNHPVLGCDALVFAEAEIAKTPKVLNSTLDLLFKDDFDYGFPPANFIASTQNKLEFDSAVIEKGIAKVFLKGEMIIEDGVCDKARVGYQITETAKQFPTVKSVEIYLNGNKIEL